VQARGLPRWLPVHSSTGAALAQPQRWPWAVPAGQTAGASSGVTLLLGGS